MIGVSVLYGAYTILFLTPFFDVESIDVRGDLHFLNKDEVVAMSGIEMGDHLLRIPVDGVQKRLTENPWIKEAAVHRKFPHLVWIFVKEHVPDALIRLDSWYYVDRFGKVFKPVEQEDDRNFPIITGFEEKSSEFQIAQLLKVKDLYMNSTLGETYGLSEIHFDENRGVSIITFNDPLELRLGFGPFMEKMGRLETAYPAIKAHGGVIAYVDLSSEGKVVVKYGT